MNGTFESAITDLPQSFFERVGHMLGNFSIGFYRIDGSGSNEDMVLLECGTLVKIDGIHAILTAHHVIEILPNHGGLGILTTTNAHRKAVDTQGISYLKIARGMKDSDGPDIGAILLSPAIASTLAAEKIILQFNFTP